ncbi:hypothetical protein FPOA_00191 [Fusarium poae]|uniref:Uncharacterized protein n=1 Tax=Fusarium poae TaxID=36050 RepID=A0A1B8B0N2_FUSPO|nr:hypothetical protein FPOA_00191 [Fusarium poae]
MISQIWIWIIDEGTIITATAEPDGINVPRLTNAKDFHDAVLDKMVNGEGGNRFSTPTSVHSVMELMLGVATNTFMSDSVPTLGKKISPIDIFRESIKDVVNAEAGLFQRFLEELEQNTDDRGRHQQNLWSSKIIPRSTNHIIDLEAKLLREVRDIRDELGMLKALSEHQETVWKQAFETDELRACFQYYHPCTPTDVKGDLDTMVAETDRVIDSLNSLLDLRTKQAAIKEAEYGRIQTEDAARQSKSVLIFTIVTVIFLPLSFLSSLFALDVSSFPHESGSVKYESGWIFPILFGVTAIVSIPVTILALKASSISRQLKPESKSEV